MIRKWFFLAGFFYLFIRFDAFSGALTTFSEEPATTAFPFLPAFNQSLNESLISRETLDHFERTLEMAEVKYAPLKQASQKTPLKHLLFSPYPKYWGETTFQKSTWVSLEALRDLFQPKDSSGYLFFSIPRKWIKGKCLRYMFTPNGLCIMCIKSYIVKCPEARFVYNCFPKFLSIFSSSYDFSLPLPLTAEALNCARGISFDNQPKEENLLVTCYEKSWYSLLGGHPKWSIFWGSFKKVLSFFNI